MARLRSLDCIRTRAAPGEIPSTAVKRHEQRFLYMANDRDEFIYFPMLTVSEAARFLGVGKKVVYQLIEFGQVRAVRQRGAVLIEKKSLEDLRSSGKMI